MVIDKNRKDFNDFILNGQHLEEVKEFDYLGSMINTEADVIHEIKRRLNIARTSIQKMDKIWKSRAISSNLKL